MDMWKKITSDAHRLFKQRQYHSAGHLYLKALERAKFIYYRWSAPKESIDCLVNSHLNIANNLLQLTEYNTAIKYLLQGHRIFQTMLNASDSEQENYQYLTQAKVEIGNSIAEIIQQHPNVKICQSCYFDIFGHSPDYQNIYRIN
ncbi:hypothetical protein [Aliikangiella sp. IMCC44359]|uniref:hypothetical protein n=1 Tax=Aliikangiella sp. IMCC44359 TaxID=3459125 RepID=UPI00403A9B87